MTYAEYTNREVVAPYVFVARAMNDKRIVDDANAGRLYEAAATLAPDDADAVQNRLVEYSNEGKWLFDHKASRTILRLVDVVGTFVSDAAKRFGSAPQVMRGVAWMAWYDAESLEVVGRGDEAVPLADDGLDHVDASWEDATALTGGFTGVLLDRMTELQTKGEYAKSVDVVRKHIKACIASAACLNNLYLTYDAWCVKYQVAKDWPGAKKVMTDCIALLPDDTRCHKTLSGLESMHPE